MPVNNVSVGTDHTVIIAKSLGYVVDFLVQNLSANTVYFVSSTTQGTGNGIKIDPSGGYFSAVEWEEDVLLLADGATSDVRYVYQVKKKVT